MEIRTFSVWTHRFPIESKHWNQSPTCTDTASAQWRPSDQWVPRIHWELRFWSSDERVQAEANLWWSLHPRILYGSLGLQMQKGWLQSWSFDKQNLKTTIVKLRPGTGSMLSLITSEDPLQNSPYELEFLSASVKCISLSKVDSLMKGSPAG